MNSNEIENCKNSTAHDLSPVFFKIRYLEIFLFLLLVTQPPN